MQDIDTNVASGSAMQDEQAGPEPSSPDVDFTKIGFGYIKTDYNLRCYWRDGQWSDIEVCSDETIPIHMAATCLHYGQEAFEGLKARRCPDGKLRVFRAKAGAERLQRSCRGIMMPELPVERFMEMVERLVRLNMRFVPPYESGASLYLRPLMIGTSAHVGVHPSEEYLFVMFATPVGPYFKGGFAANPYVITRDFDRAAPLGTGCYKVGGNYAGSLRAHHIAHEQGYSCEFYLDTKEKRYIDEAGAANFFGIKDGVYVTPKSTSILPSITNDAIMTIARDMGIKVEQRHIPVEELAEMQEAGACGTAAVISPIERIDDPDTGHSYHFGEPGPVSRRLYDAIVAVQYGLAEDKWGWNMVI